MTEPLFEDGVKAGVPHSDNGTGPEEATTAPAIALAESRVDLVELIRNGIPERQFVPGCAPWLIAGKRYLVPAAAGVGKSLAALVVGVEVVAHGGTVAILDVENGSEEYAKRLEDILSDREDLADDCAARLRYHAWPALKASWQADEWLSALAGTDLVVFDSSRLVLTAMGLGEDSNDDYAQFVNALLIPLARGGVSTLVLDNEGHEGGRARGASDKSDLNEVVYVAKVGRPFDRHQSGELHLYRKRTRFSDLPAQLTMTLGGGVYQAPVALNEETKPFRPTGLMEKASTVIEGTPGLSRKDVLSLVGGKHDYSSAALSLLVSEGYVRTERDGKEQKHYSMRPYRDPDYA